MNGEKGSQACKKAAASGPVHRGVLQGDEVGRVRVQMSNSDWTGTVHACSPVRPSSMVLLAPTSDLRQACPSARRWHFSPTLPVAPSRTGHRPCHWHSCVRCESVWTRPSQREATHVSLWPHLGICIQPLVRSGRPDTDVSPRSLSSTAEHTVRSSAQSVTAITTNHNRADGTPSTSVFGRPPLARLAALSPPCTRPGPRQSPRQSQPQSRSRFRPSSVSPRLRPTHPLQSSWKGPLARCLVLSLFLPLTRRTAMDLSPDVLQLAPVGLPFLSSSSLSVRLCRRDCSPS